MMANKRGKNIVQHAWQEMTSEDKIYAAENLKDFYAIFERDTQRGKKRREGESE
mgnify:CR=1 FL=1